MSAFSETVPDTFSFWSPLTVRCLSPSDLLDLVRLDDQVALVADPLERVVLDPHVLVLLGVDEDLLRALLVFEADLVEAAAPLAGAGLEGRLGRLLPAGCRAACSRSL